MPRPLIYVSYCTLCRRIAPHQTTLGVYSTLCESSTCCCHGDCFGNEPAAQERSMDERERWDAYYASRVNTYAVITDADKPHPFLRHHLALLPRGRVLELAMGEGHNAKFLARQGFSV